MAKHIAEQMHYFPIRFMGRYGYEVIEGGSLIGRVYRSATQQGKERWYAELPAPAVAERQAIKENPGAEWPVVKYFRTRTEATQALREEQKK